MRVVVTSSGDTLNSPVDPRFGRAPKLILVDTETNETKVFDNADGVNAMQGAGVQAAERVSQLGAECLITGHCGPKAYHTLEAGGVHVYTGIDGTVAEAIEKLRSGELETAPGPDVRGHWR